LLGKKKLVVVVVVDQWAWWVFSVDLGKEKEVWRIGKHHTPKGGGDLYYILSYGLEYK